MNDLPGKEELFKFLADTGLTPEALEAMRKKVDAAKKDVPAAPKTLVSDDELRAADARQLEAYDRLCRWYTLWSGILRDGLDYHARVQLGVTEVKGGRKSGSSTDDTTDPGAGSASA
jgi:hypothetical protein